MPEPKGASLTNAAMLAEFTKRTEAISAEVRKAKDEQAEGIKAEFAQINATMDKGFALLAEVTRQASAEMTAALTVLAGPILTAEDGAHITTETDKPIRTNGHGRA